VKRILGLLGWLGVALVVAAVGIKYLPWFRDPVRAVDWALWPQRLAFAGLVVTALYALSQWRDIGRSFQGRNVRYGSVAAGSVVVLLAILAGINWIGTRHSWRKDLTAAKQFSMSDQTKKIVTGLKKPVEIRVFYDSTNSSQQEYRDVLREYEHLSTLFTAEYIDAVKDPVQAKQYDIQAVPTVVVAYDGRTERATAVNEQSLTNALKKVIEGKAKKMYFVQGHSEHDIADSTTRTGYAGLAAKLKDDNFDVLNLTLAQEGKVPDDATVLVIAGPKGDYLPQEVEVLRGYLKRGGKLLMLIDPPEKPDSPQPTGLIAFAKEWGIDIGNNLIIDKSGFGQAIGAGPAVPLAMPMPEGHAITRDFRKITAFPLARSVTPIAGGAEGHVAQKLLQTSPQSWAETDIKGLVTTNKAESNPDKGDTVGPVALAAAVSAPATDAPPAATPGAPPTEARMVVVGDSDFASNSAIEVQGNGDLTLNMANWLAQQEDMIAIRPRDPDDRRITLTQDQGTLIFWSTFVIIPLLLLGNAVRVYWRRR
jgi:ABC-type uncharacterized transport system involved in gliding motility auxiliary subunit